MFPKVQKGQRFQPSASMHNAVVDMLNKTNGMLAGEQKSGNQNMVRVSVRNNTETALESGSPVALSGCSLDDMIFEVRKVQKTDTVVAVIVNTIEPNKVGSAVMFGIAEISVSGEAKKFVAPVPNSFTWQYADFGMPVLATLKSGAIILISSAGKGNQNLQDRPFIASYNSETAMIDITGGWAVCNGEYKEVLKDSLGVMDGYICVVGKWNGETQTYDTPLFFYEEPAANHIPIAKITIGEDGNVNIVNFYVSTVIINETTLHPPCECLTGEKK